MLILTPFSLHFDLLPSLAAALVTICLAVPCIAAVFSARSEDPAPSPEAERLNGRLAALGSELAREAILWLDERGGLVWVNEAACLLLGCRAGSLIGKPFSRLAPDFPGQPGIHQITLQRADGTGVNVEVKVSEVEVEGNSYRCLCLRDLSEELRMQSELNSARQMAVEALDTRGILFGNMSHELRTPLSSIIGFSQFMQNDANLSNEQREYLHTINRSGQELLGLINNVLDLTQLESGRVSLYSKDFDLKSLLKNLLDSFRQRAQAHNLSFSANLSQDLPQFICADEHKLEQILLNLFDNALRNTQEGGIRLEFSIRPEKHAPNVLLVTMTDSGQPIPEDYLPFIFDVFSTDSPLRQHPLINSLELAISREFARMMGGDLQVGASEEGGCTVTFWVNYNNAAAQPAATVENEVEPATIQLRQPVRRLLIAEDQAESRLLLLKILQPLGFEIREVANGQEAVDAWSAWKPDLIWMNLRMPVMNGLEAAEQIRRDPAGKQTVIIAVTASNYEEALQELPAQIFDDLVCKPLDPAEVLEILEKHLHTLLFTQLTPERLVPAYIHVSKDDETNVVAMLANLSEEYIEELRRVTSQGDMESIQKAIGKIKTEQPYLGNLLDGIAQVFEYDRILRILEVDEEIRKYSGEMDDQPGNLR